jgi:hypothetical protein
MFNVRLRQKLENKSWQKSLILQKAVARGGAENTEQNQAIISKQPLPVFA